MGTTKRRNGDGHIIFHVGKELPANGNNLMLVPGVQNAQGRGVYFSDEPRLQYSGGEHFQEKLNIAPIFCVPMKGTWIRGKRHKKYGGEVSYNSDGKIIALFDLHSFDSELNDMPVRYYYPREMALFKEPCVTRKGRYATSELSNTILKGDIGFNAALEQLYEKNGAPEVVVGEEYILEKMKEAVNEGRLPGTAEIEERLSELRNIREYSEHSCMGVAR